VNEDRLAPAAQPAAASRWSLFDLVGSGVAVTGADGTLEYCNPALLRLLAQNAEAVRGTSMFALLEAGADGALESVHRAALEAN
jgi:PAS domain-containing protein